MSAYMHRLTAGEPGQIVLDRGGEVRHKKGVADTSNTFDCPLCNRTIKVTKAGKVSRHGHRRYTSGNTNGCATSGRRAGTDALDASASAIASHRSELQAKQAVCETGMRVGMIDIATRDLVAVLDLSLRVCMTEQMAAEVIDHGEVFRRTSRLVTEQGSCAEPNTDEDQDYLDNLEREILGELEDAELDAATLRAILSMVRS